MKCTVGDTVSYYYSVERQDIRAGEILDIDKDCMLTVTNPGGFNEICVYPEFVIRNLSTLLNELATL